jgi:hypothetical protein
MSLLKGVPMNRNHSKSAAFLVLLSAFVLFSCDNKISTLSSSASGSSSAASSVAASSSVSSSSVSSVIDSASSSSSQTSSVAPTLPYDVATAIGKIAATQTSVNKSVISVEDKSTNPSTVTAYTTDYVKDKNGNDAIVTKYTSWGTDYVETVGTTAVVPGKAIILSDSGSYSSFSQTDTKALGGYQLQNTFGWSNSAVFYGVGDFTSGVYALSQDANAKNYKDISDGLNYGFSFGYLTNDYSYQEATVTFVLSAQDVLTSSVITVKDYASDFTKNDTTGAITPGETYTAKVYTSTQEVGTRASDTDIDFSQYFFTGLTLTYEDSDSNAITDLSNIENGSSYFIDLADTVTGSKATTNLDTATMTVTTGDASGLDLSCWNNQITVRPNAVGTFVLHIATARASADVTLTVHAAVAKTITVMAIADNGDGTYSISSPIGNDEVTAYDDTPFLLTASFLPSAAEQGYAVTTTNTSAVVSQNVSFPGQIITFTGAMISVSETACDVPVTVASTQTGSTASKTFTIHFIDRPSYAAVTAIGFLYQQNNIAKYVLSFEDPVATSTGYTGTATITDKEASTTEHATYVATYDSSNKAYAYVFTHTSGNLTLLASGKLDRYDQFTLIDANSNSYVFYPYTALNALNGAWTATVDSLTYTMTFSRDGEVVISHYSDTESINNTYTFSLSAKTDGTYGITVKAGPYTSSDAAQSFISLSDTTSYLTADFSTLNFSIKKEGATDYALTAFTQVKEEGGMGGGM